MNRWTDGSGIKGGPIDWRVNCGTGGVRSLAEVLEDVMLFLLAKKWP